MKLDWKPKSELDKAGIRIVRLLKKSGHQAYWVGGAVRDILNDRDYTNLDLATSASPDDVESVLDKNGIVNKPVGKKFGTILGIADKFPIEITTFRSEGGYKDKRHPDQIKFVSSYEVDAERRDLTINCLYFDPETREVFDPENGIKDMELGLIRFIGDPKKRLEEDYLRLIRAVRFATVLDFKFEKNSFAAIKTRAKYIQNVSSERVKAELDKILLSENRGQGIRLLESTGLLKFILPELDQLQKISHGSKRYHLEGNIFNHTINVIDAIPQDLDLIYAGLFHDIGKVKSEGRKMRNGEWITSFSGHPRRSADVFKKFARKYRFPKASATLIHWLVLHHDDRINFMKLDSSEQVRYVLSSSNISKLIEVWRADSSGTLRLNEQGDAVPGNSKSYYQVQNIVKEMKSKSNIISKLVDVELIIRETKINPGPIIGKIILLLKEKIILGIVNNDKDVKTFLKNFPKIS